MFIVKLFTDELRMTSFHWSKQATTPKVIDAMYYILILMKIVYVIVIIDNLKKYLINDEFCATISFI